MNRNKMAGWISIHLLFASVFFVSSESVAASGVKASLSVNISKTRSRESEHNMAQKGNVSVTTTVEKETCAMEIEVENPAEQAGDYDVQWCVISKRISGKDSEKLVISDSGKIEITRGGKMTGTETINPKPFVFTITSIDRAGNPFGLGNVDNSTQTREGDTYAGYLVLVKAGGEILAQDSNDDRFLKEEWLAQFEKAMQLKASLKAKQKKKK